MAKKKPALRRSSTSAAKKKATSKKSAAKKAAPKGEAGKLKPRAEFVTKYVPCAQIVPVKALQTRAQIKDIASLKSSIRVNGIEQSLVVRPSPGRTDKYELVVGNRRFAAATELNLKSVPVIVRTDLGDNIVALGFAASENSSEGRSELSPLDQANVYKRLTDAKLKPKEIGRRCGCSDQHVRLTMRLLDAPKAIQSALAKGDLRTGAAVAVASLPDAVRKRVMAELEPGTTEAQVRARANEIANEIGTSANPNRTGSSSAASSTEGLALTRSRSEMNQMADDHVVDILNTRDSKGDTTALEASLATIFWYFGKIEKIETTSKKYKKAFAAIARDVEFEEA